MFPRPRRVGCRLLFEAVEVQAFLEKLRGGNEEAPL
jgi:hypothetical protein